ncbi:DNA-binding LacI/PurR family transcriptional regulator [Thermocatellispora tengchongensis]|uniref:DNA-binding LacI/PurR family transcriptional regulator n=2 Tax=Thermocatellispora tengchongensis TaxID=1073253 RepID=A0A840P6P2_9ACTN|nr:LacI family DNA-binding transcriptional regulator [Thermocatellispora tengchongensis]MBB5134992.1 DNA-binding LacI/PurR family transcriptional regulator [Thermocatellispora tengchongensis]
MADVAAMAGVSSQTVSRVANNRSNVEEETRQRVLSAMRVLGYRPNAAARALVTDQFRTLGLISFGLGNFGNARTVDSITRAAQRAGYTVNMLAIESQTEQAVHEAFGQLTMQAVDGIVLIEAQILDTPALRLPSGVPVVLADGDVSHRHPMVDTDQALGARLVTRHLLDLGHETVWHVAGPEDSYAARRRAESWHATLKEAGAPIPRMLFGDWSAASGYAAGRVLAEQPGVTAVFAANDQMALGVMRAFIQAGRRIPEDVSIAGFDDLDESAYFSPPLTTVRQDFDVLAERIVSLMLDQIRGGTAPSATAPIAPHLIIRESTAAPPD